MRIEGTADKLVGFYDPAVFQFNALRLVVLYNYPLDLTTTDYPAAIFGDELAEQVSKMVRTHVGKTEMICPVHHERYKVAQTFQVIIESPHCGTIKEECPDLVILEPRVHDLFWCVSRQLIIPLCRRMGLQLCHLLQAGHRIHIACRGKEKAHGLL
ncbi:MAG: hypothetical protein A4E62_02188 [Syntrophorhabdus sp. PtaU1.Bin002]|nr:MAG: hypothetical protein A4E62_02188 [Syntrophorhabdus sp. PtaU1.Bin002]